MPIIKTLENGKTIISIFGKMDARFIQTKRTELEAITKTTAEEILFDLSGVDFIDSSGIGFLVYTYKRIKPLNQAIGLIGLTGQPKTLIKMLKIDRLISCADNLHSYEEQQKNSPRSNPRATLRKMLASRVFTKRGGNYSTTANSSQSL